MAINTSFKMVHPFGFQRLFSFKLFIIVKDGCGDFFVLWSSFLVNHILREGRSDVVVFVERRRAVVRIPEVGLVLS